MWQPTEWDDGLISIQDPTRRPPIPKDLEFVCYICKRPSLTYRGLRTYPPDPHLIHPPADPNKCLSESIVPVATCGSQYCEMMEFKRQNAIFNVLVQPIREKFIAEREARINRARSRAKNTHTEEDQ